MHLSTHLYEKVPISAPEAGNPDRGWQHILRLEHLVQIYPKVLLDAQGLQEKSTHPHDALLRGIALELEGIEQNQDDEVVSPLGVDNEGSEPLVALSDLPKQHYDLGGEPDRGLGSGDVGRISLQGLVEDPRHPIHDELEVLGPVKAAQEVTVVILRRGTILLRDGVEQSRQEELQRIGHENLLGVFEHEGVVRHPPAGWVVLERLAVSARKQAPMSIAMTYRVQQRAQHGEDDLLVRAGADVGERLDSLLRKDARQQVHALASESQQEAQDLAAIALVLPCGRNRRVAANAALPDGVGDLGLAVGCLGDGEVGEEEQVKQGVDELFGERLRVLKLVRGGFGLHILCAVEEDLVGDGRLPGQPAARRPEQVLLPLLQRIRFMDEREDTGQNADAVQGFAAGGEFGVREGGVVAKHEQMACHGLDQAFQVLAGIVASATHVGRGEEAEDVFGGLGQLPELEGIWSDEGGKAKDRSR